MIIPSLLVALLASHAQSALSKDALAMVRSNRMPFTRYDTSEVNVKRFNGSALVTGRLQRERNMNGKNVTDNWRFTKVYVMSQGQWRVIAWHASPAAP